MPQQPAGVNENFPKARRRVGRHTGRVTPSEQSVQDGCFAGLEEATRATVLSFLWCTSPCTTSREAGYYRRDPNLMPQGNAYRQAAGRR